MSSNFNNLIALTRAMGQALARNDLELCSMLIDERGRMLAKLIGENSDEDHLEPPLREALAEVSQQDAELEERLCLQLAGTGSELTRLRGHRCAGTGKGSGKGSGKGAGKQKARRFDSRA